MKKKYVFIVMLGTLVYGFLCAQQPSKNDSIYTALQGIQKALEEKNYTRIPNQDFDKALEIKLADKVNAQVTDRIDTIRNIVFLVLAIIGGALLLGLRTMVNNSVSEQLKEKSKEVDADMKEKIKFYYLEFIKEDVEKELSQQKIELRKEIEGVIVKSDELARELNLAKQSLLVYNLNNLKAEKSNRDYAKNFELAKKYLADAEKLGDKDTISLALAELSTAAYMAKKDSEIEDIIDGYMNARTADIKETVFINLAGGLFYEYASTRDIQTKNKALKYINASLRKVNDYGEALALKLEFLMVDYEEGYNEEAKNKIKHEAAVIIDNVMGSAYSPGETIGRFKRVAANPIEKRYIDILYTLFEKELKLMEAKVNAAPKPVQ
jgi:hypothetical protein